MARIPALLPVLLAAACGPGERIVVEPPVADEPVVETVCMIEPLPVVSGPECETGPIPDLASEASLEPWAEKVVAEQTSRLGSKDPVERQVAARVLGAIGPGAAVAAPSLVDALEDVDVDARLRAAAALWRIGVSRDAVLPVLVEVIKSGDLAARMAALDAMAEVGPHACEHVDLIATLLDDEPPGLRAKAASALGAVGPLAWTAVPDLVRMLEDPVPWVASKAYIALGTIGEPSLGALVDALGSENEAAVKGALAAMVGMKSAARDAMPALVCMIGDKSWENRRLAFMALGAMVGPADGELVPALVAGLSDENIHVRPSAQGALVMIGEEAAPVLAALIATGDEEQCRMATWALVAMEGRAAAAVPELIEVLVGDGETHQLEAACLVLQHVVPGHVPDESQKTMEALASSMKDEGWDLRWRSAVALGEFGTPAIPHLIEALDDPDPTVMRYGAEALGRMGEDAAPAVGSLVALLERDDWRAHDAACIALGQIGPSALEAVPLLVEELASAPHVAAWSAATALGGIGAAAGDAVPEILEAFPDSDPSHLEFYPAALGHMGVHAKDALPDLVAMLEHPMAEVRSQAAWALGQMGPEAKDAVKPLTAAVEDGYMGFNVNAIKALGRIGPGATKSLPVLLKAMSRTGYSKVRVIAMQAAVDMKASPKKVLPVLIEALGDPDPEVRSGACHAIRGYGPDAAKAAAELGKLLEDPERRNESSWAALAALASIGPGARDAAASIIWSLQYLGTREGAGMALRSIGEAAVPAMIDALPDEAWSTDDELARVLGLILRGEPLKEG